MPRGVALGDLDGDGDLDFVSANYQSNTVSVMRNNGNGTFAAIGSPVATGTRPVAIALANFDGDSDLDIAVTSNTTNTVSILLNNGAGGFTAAASPATGAGPRGIAAGDFDGDGDADLAVANFGANTLSILSNNGSGVFTALGAPLATANNPYAVTVGDLDGDGDLDIATSNSGNSSISVFRNDGSGAFTPASGSPFAVGVSPGGVVMGDFDEDGDLDLSTANFGSSTTSILINTAALYSVAFTLPTLKARHRAPAEISYSPSAGLPRRRPRMSPMRWAVRRQRAATIQSRAAPLFRDWPSDRGDPYRHHAGCHDRAY